MAGCVHRAILQATDAVGTVLLDVCNLVGQSRIVVRRFSRRVEALLIDLGQLASGPPTDFVGMRIVAIRAKPTANCVAIGVARRVTNRLMNGATIRVANLIADRITSGIMNCVMDGATIRVINGITNRLSIRAGVASVDRVD